MAKSHRQGSNQRCCVTKVALRDLSDLIPGTTLAPCVTGRPALALTPTPSGKIVELMQKAWTPPVRWVFVVATFLGVFSTLQAYRLMTLDMQKPMEPELFRLLILN